MDNDYRLYTYAFLSRVMSDNADARFIKDLKANKELLEVLGEESSKWFSETSDEDIIKELNVDFSSTFIMSAQPVESFVLDAKSESLVGLQNPVMAFYYNNGFDVKMNQTEIMAPDHLSIEFAFMQTLIYRKEDAPQLKFMNEHLFVWVIPYMMGVKSMLQTPFYKDFCDFTIEFLCADLEYLEANKPKEEEE
ncbi:MAG: dehydrogenase [Helicobacteraceae bacterium]|nr:dehydrogenase [Helicobacteraceae bacterium]